MHGDDSVVSSRSQDVSEGFLRKLSATLADAVEQLDAADSKRQASRMISPCSTSMIGGGNHQARYIAQIDAHLLQHPVDGAGSWCSASGTISFLSARPR